jgi:hypothetical protein
MHISSARSDSKKAVSVSNCALRSFFHYWIIAIWKGFHCYLAESLCNSPRTYGPLWFYSVNPSICLLLMEMLISKETTIDFVL